MLEAGRRVGPYVVESLLGMGGMGEVYRARDERLHRTIALKVVRADREDKTGVAPRDRLIAEARAAAALRHPNVVEIFDAGKDGGETYVAMDFIDGKPLRAYVGDPTVPLATRKRWVLEIARALAAAHRAGLVHRDIKPENVIIDREGVARVLDFGLAKRLVVDTNAPTADGPAPETIAGRVLGTVSYMAPEQLAGARPDPRWDQFAWAVLAYELLTGVHPRQTVPMPGQTAHLGQTPKMPNEVAPEIAFADASAIMLAMAPDPARRFASMDAVLEAMKEYRTISRAAEPKPPAEERPKRWPLPVMIAFALIVGVVIGRVMQRDATPVTRAPKNVASAIAIVSVPTASVSPVAPVVSVTPVASSAPAQKAQLPADWLTGCSCYYDGVRLCPPNAKLSERWCSCQSDGIAVFDDVRSDLRRGVGLADGQPCSGHIDSGEVLQGKLTNCLYRCDAATFSGLHRTRCRGLSASDGKPREGLLYCY